MSKIPVFRDFFGMFKSMLIVSVLAFGICFNAFSASSYIPCCNDGTSEVYDIFIDNGTSGGTWWADVYTEIMAVNGTIPGDNLNASGDHVNALGECLSDTDLLEYMNNNNLYGLKCYVAPPAMAEDYFYSGNPSGWREDDKGDMYYRSEFYTYAFYIGYVNSCGKYLEPTVFDAKGFKQDNIADALTAYTTYQDKFFAYLAKQQGYTEHKAFVCEKSSNMKLFCVPDKGYLVNAATQDIQNVINQDTLPINEYGEPLFSNVYYDDGFDNHLDGYALVLALKDKSVSPALQYFDFRNKHSDAANLIYYDYKNSPDDDTSVSWDLYEQMNSSGIGLSNFIGLFRGTLDGHDYIKYDENTCTTIDDNLNSIGLPLINGLQRCELPLALNIEPYVLTNLSDSSSGKQWEFSG